MKKQLLAGACALAVAGSGAAAIAQTSAPTLTLDVGASSIAFEGQPQVQTGYNRFVLENQRKGEAAVGIVRLKQGVTQEQFGAAVGKIQDPSQVERYGSLVASTFWVGGPARYATTIKLDNADYAVVDMTKKPQVKLGFHAGPAANAAVAPKADVDVKLGDYAFSMPRTLKAGAHTVEVGNVGKHVHHALIVPLKRSAKDSKVIADIDKGKEPRSAMAGPPSALVEAVSPGTVNDVELKLRKGKYLFVCFMQNSARSKPHAMLGMRKIVNVK